MGIMVYTWGDVSRRKDVASAVKPLYTHFLLKAVEDGKIKSIDEPVYKVAPRLRGLNEALGYKDREITWRHLCNQISCYGVRERPGQAFDYSDWNMALLFDSLFLKVYGTSWEKVDSEVLGPGLTDLLGCQDKPTFMAFGTGNRPGRLAISPRDFARFGLLYLRKGNWNGKQLINAETAAATISTPLPISIPRTKGAKGEMIKGHDPGAGLNAKVLDQWEQWFSRMDESGIVIYFFFYDDSVRLWKTGDTVGEQERGFVRGIVDRFEHHKNLIWCVAEEYQEGLSVMRVKKLAAEIRHADDYDHAIAVHKLNGLGFAEFADDANIDQFAIQYNENTADALHDGMVRAWAEARGRYSLNMSEAKGFGGGRSLREKSWACAMGGAYVMVLDMVIANTRPRPQDIFN